MKPRFKQQRRQVLKSLLAGVAGSLLWPLPGLSSQQTLLSKAIPGSGERIPLIGLGSWITFNVGNDPEARNNCARVIKNFVDAGGRMIDSSPMYGSSQQVIGYALSKTGLTNKVFATDKVWIAEGEQGPAQMEQSRRYWQITKFDLMQVHNLLAWEEHLQTLRQMKAEGKLRYLGITTSHGRRHAELEKIMQKEPLDFVQLTYNILDREAEQRLLPLAREKGIAVIANRPFQRGDLIDTVKQHPLPAWAKECDCDNWAQFLLKFIVSHPAVTCAIPATSRVDHVMENMGAARGQLPDAKLRQRMIDYVKQL